MKRELRYLLAHFLRFLAEKLDPPPIIQQYYMGEKDGIPWFIPIPPQTPTDQQMPYAGQ